MTMKDIAILDTYYALRTVARPGHVTSHPAVLGRMVIAGIKPEDIDSALNQLDAVVRSIACGFGTFTELLDAKGNYRPTLSMGHLHADILADCYDAAQEARGDERRAYRRP